MAPPTIVTVLNDPFTEYFLVLLFSILKHNPSFNLPVKIIHTATLSPLSKENQERIRKLYKNVEFIFADEKPYERFFPMTPIHLHAALLKLEAFNVPGADRVLFLDSDMLCLGNLDFLFDLDVPFAAVAAGKNRIVKEEKAGRTRFRTSFNSGVMLIGKKYLDGSAYQKILQSPLRPCPTADQDIINRYFKWRRVYCIDHRYNYNSAFFWREGDEKEVKILHYTGPKPLTRPEEPRMRIWFRYYNEFKNNN